MVKAAAIDNANNLDVDMLIGTSTVSYYKDAVAARSVASLDYQVASQRVGTHVDDNAFGLATDPVLALAALADETASDSVDEGDIGIVRMTLNRRLILASHLLDDAAFGIGTGYVSALGALADETASDPVDEGDIGAPRMTLNRRLITAGQFLDDAAFTPAVDYSTVIGALADETASDSVDEGDSGALRMTLNRRLITAGQYLDDAAYAPTTDYSTVLGAMADETAPDSVNEGDSGALRMTLARALHVAHVADVASLSNVASAATSATIIAANDARVGLLIFNDDANALLIKYGATASATSYTHSIPTGTGWTMPAPIYRGIIDGIWGADGAGSARVTELT